MTCYLHTQKLERFYLGKFISFNIQTHFLVIWNVYLSVSTQVQQKIDITALTLFHL